MVVCFSFLLFACGGGGGGGSSAPSAVATQAPAQVVSIAPTLTLSASSNSIAYNGATTISWSSTNTTSCSSSGGGGTGTSGTFGTGSLTSSTSYTVTCTGSNGSVTQSTTVNVAPQVVVGCSTTGATGAISLSNLPSRLTGVAPLSVFFDAAGTTATSTTKPYHELEYRWDFGDAAGSPVSGTTWKYGARANVSSRNAALGPQAAHVFETPGTYAVTLTAKDGSNTVSNNCTRIVVQDPEVVFTGTNTVCFSTAGNFAGCPTGASRVQTSNFPLAVNTYKGTNKRLLFRRGEQFTAASPARISVNGPGVVGAFGTASDPKPIILRSAGAGEVILVGGSAAIGDWRIMDLEIDGQNAKDPYNKGIDAVSEFRQLLVLRLNIHGTWRGVVADNGVLAPGQGSMAEWSITDSLLTGIPGCNSPSSFANCDWRAMISGTRHAIQGNYMDNEDTGGSHVIRSSYLNKGIISNNDIARAGIIQHAIKLHAPNWSGGAGGNFVAGMYTEQVNISDNKITGGINPWTVSIGPQNDVTDERVRDIIVERNWFVAGSQTAVNVDISSAKSTVRNNIFSQASASLDHKDVWITRRGIEPTPDDVRVYGNSSFSQTGGVFLCIDVDNATNVVVKANLAWAPNSSNTRMVGGVMVSNAIIQNNSTDIQVKTTSPLWIGGNPLVPAGFAIASNSYAYGTGGVLATLSDFFGAISAVSYKGGVRPQ